MRENKIKVLDDVTHVLTVPSRYVGSVNPAERSEYILVDGKYQKQTVIISPAVITLFKEVVSNSIDEFIRTGGKFANEIEVKFDEKCIKITDNGRGLPSDIEETTGLPESVVAFTHLKAGTNFTDTDTSTSIGQNGEGVSLVNVFSKKFHVDTSNGKARTRLTCSDNMGKVEYKLLRSSGKFTSVYFELDFERFGLTRLDSVHQSVMSRIVRDYSMCYPNIKFTLNDEKIKLKNFKDYVSCYTDDFESFNFDNLDIGIFSSEDFEFVSFVNGINTRRGGVHVDYVVGQIVNEIRDRIIKKYKTIKPADIKNKLGFVINLKNMIAPRFDSQTKEELINKNVDWKMVLLKDFDPEYIAVTLIKSKTILEPVIEFFRVKEEFKRREELKGQEKKLSPTLIPKLMEANSKDRSKCILYIGEGKSAVGSMFMTCRDTNYHAGYPLRGRFISCQDKLPNELMKNSEVSDLCAILNLKLSSQDISGLRYGKIAIMTDQDVDGFSIKLSLINFFFTFWPDLIHKGILTIAESPLIKAVKAGKTEKFFSLASFNEINHNGEWKVIAYNKGLGSLDGDDYAFSMGNLVRVKADNIARQSLDLAFGENNEDKRKEWMR